MFGTPMEKHVLVRLLSCRRGRAKARIWNDGREEELASVLSPLGRAGENIIGSSFDRRPQKAARGNDRPLSNHILYRLRSCYGDVLVVR